MKKIFLIAMISMQLPTISLAGTASGVIKTVTAYGNGSLGAAIELEKPCADTRNGFYLGLADGTDQGRVAEPSPAVLAIALSAHAQSKPVSVGYSISAGRCVVTHITVK